MSPITSPIARVHYISNKEFTADIIEYIATCEAEELLGRTAPVIPMKIAKQFIAMSTKLGTRFNFVNYTFKDEMVSSALFACCAKIRKFDGKISQNAFAYFTNVCWRAFVDVINHEEKMSYIKAKCFQNIDYSEGLDVDDLSEFADHAGSLNDFIPYFDTGEYEEKIRSAKARQTKVVKKTSAHTLDIE